jgi:hypothetical protein
MSTELEAYAAARMPQAVSRADEIQAITRELEEARRSQIVTLRALAALLALVLSAACVGGALVSWTERDPTALLAALGGTVLLGLGPVLALGHHRGFVLTHHPALRTELAQTGVRGRAILTRYVVGRAVLRLGARRHAIDRAYFAVQTTGAPYEVLLHVVADLHARRRVEANGVVVYDMPAVGERFDVFVDRERPELVHLPPRRGEAEHGMT